jgi:hypothetical protein
MHNNLSIATMTWARDAKEEKLLRESLLELSKLNIPAFITDGGSGTDFLNFIRSFPTFTLLEPKAKGVWPQVQASLNAAYEAGSPFIIYTEPDKMDFIKQGLPDMLTRISVNEQSGVIIAVRSSPGFESYPRFQQMTETTINNCCAEVTGNDTDYTYGPFIMNRLLVPYLHELNNNIGWGWRPYTFVIASRLNYKVEPFEGDYFCPVDQRDDDALERIYRMKQLSENIEAIVLASKASLNN